MNRIVKIFMERDGISEADAEQEYSDRSDEVLDRACHGAMFEQGYIEDNDLLKEGRA